jgi:hypothetical protein
MTLSGISFNTNHRAFDALRPRPFFSLPPARTLTQVRLAGLMVSNSKNRVRVCLHASNTWRDIYSLVNAYVTRNTGMAQDEHVGPEGDEIRIEKVNGMGPSRGNKIVPTL